MVYRYQGAALKAPVTLREEVISQKKNHLEIEVTARRGKQLRRWIQAVTDTPGNERRNKVDALFEVDAHGARHRLANRNNADLYRLYGWTLIKPDGPARHVVHQKVLAQVAGKTYVCTRRRGENTWKGQPLRFWSLACPGFLWTHAQARFWNPHTGKVLLRVQVVRAGRTAQSVNELPR